MKRFLAYCFLGIALFVALLLAVLYARYGGGDYFPDFTGPPEMPASLLEVVADLPTPPGNVAVSADERVFVTLHPEARPELKIVELINGRMEPWPNLDFQGDTEAERRAFREVLSLRIDRQNRLWTLDTGFHGLHPGRLLAFDLETGEVLHEYEFPREIAPPGSHLNDFQVSPDGRWIYIAEASFFGKRPALVVYDVENRIARRRLDTHHSVVADDYLPVVQGREMVAFGVVTIRPGVDSIALDKAGEWLYYAPVTEEYLYRIRAADLRDPAVDEESLRKRVETWASKTMSDGITMDLQDNIYLSDLEHSAILMLTPDKQLRTLLKDERIRWPDGFSFGPDGWLYFTCSALHQVIGKLPTSISANAPYQVYRFRPGPESIPGH